MTAMFECHGCDKSIYKTQASVFALCPECEKKRREKMGIPDAKPKMTTLERLKVLESKATTGPWPKLEYSLLDPQNKADRELIYAMRNSINKLLAFVQAWDDCQTVTGNQIEKMAILFQAREALDE